MEDAFKCGRKVESREQENKTVSSTRKWLAPVEQRLMSTYHRYDEVEWRSQPVSSHDAHKMPSETFKPATLPKARSFDMSGIVSPKSPGWWPSLTPSAFNCLPADMAVMAHCQRHACWEKVDDHWLCQLLGRGMLVRAHSGDAWSFTLGALEGAYDTCPSIVVLGRVCTSHA